MELVIVDRARSRPVCEERALVLQAVGLPAQIAWDGENWLLLVDEGSAASARAQLARYALENPPRRSRSNDRLSADAWMGSAAYAALLLVTGMLAARRTFDVDWWDAGALVTGPVREGDWWRAITALTLHADVAHLLGNLGFGVVFGFFAGQLLGPGVAWLTVLLAAAVANYANAWIQPLSHASVGASTAVFAALGLLAAYSWRRRRDEGGRWAFRWAPLIAGVALLAFTGTGGERTDVLAHVTGFATGAAGGWWHAREGEPRTVPAGRAVQTIAAAIAIALTVVAWALALGAITR